MELDLELALTDSLAKSKPVPTNREQTYKAVPRGQETQGISGTQQCSKG